MGVARVVPMFPPEKADKVLAIVDRWANIMRQVSRFVPAGHRDRQPIVRGDAHLMGRPAL